MTDVLHDLPVDDRLTTEEVAKLMRLHPKTLSRNAAAGVYGPRVAKVGRAFRWPVPVVRQLLGLDTPTAAAL